MLWGHIGQVKPGVHSEPHGGFAGFGTEVAKNRGPEIVMVWSEVLGSADVLSRWNAFICELNMRCKEKRNQILDTVSQGILFLRWQRLNWGVKRSLMAHCIWDAYLDSYKEMAEDWVIITRKVRLTSDITTWGPGEWKSKGLCAARGCPKDSRGTPALIWAKHIGLHVETSFYTSI